MYLTEALHQARNVGYSGIVSTSLLMRTTRRFAALIALGFVAAAATRPAGAQNDCVGDCDANGAVVVNELIIGVNIALGQAPVTQCPSFDPNLSDSVEVNEIIQGVNNALAGCPAMPTPTPTPTELHVSRVEIAAGEEWRVPAGTTIVAENGMEIAGDIVAEGRGDLTLRAETGDIVLIGGAIRFADAGGEQAKPPLRVTGAAAAPRTARLHRGFDISRRGGNVFVWAKAGIVDLQRHPTSGELPQIVAQAGEAGLGLTISRWFRGERQSIIKGDDGGDGGDITITGGETVGELRLPTSVSASEGHILEVGSGGEGGSIDIEPSFDTDAAILTVIGGKGGRSGRLFLSSISAVQVPPRSSGAVIVVGAGGRGGYVNWEFLGDANLEVAPLLPLVVVTMVGGRGGDGLTYGGAGGFASYSSGFVINKRGAPITPVILYGGRGGDVFGAPAPIALPEVIGGGGAGASGVGNRGWNGGSTDGGSVLQNGRKGGSITAVGGDGGNILGNMLADFAQGGAGGKCPPLRASGRPDFVLGGPGGDGRDTCDGCAGGDGGDSGDASARGGSGGNISSFADVATFQPGDGGGVVGTYGTLLPGRAGNGNAPGEPGHRGRFTAEVGRAGVRGNIRGDDGPFTGSENVVLDGDEGTPCGEGSECACAAPRTGGEPRATSAFQGGRGTCQQCCPVPCDESAPPNTGIRVLRYMDVQSGDGFSHTYEVTAAYDPCGQRDQFGNCQVKYTFTCVSDGVEYECSSVDAGVLDVTGNTGGFLLGGFGFCHGVGNFCVGDGRACDLTLSGDGFTSRRTWQCTNCGDFGPACASEKYGACQCLNFDRTGPGTIAVCPPPCSGPRCGQ